MSSVRYYLDTSVLIHFDDNGLLDALRLFAESRRVRLLTTKTVLKETTALAKYRMSDSFYDILSDNAIEVVDDGVIPAVDRADMVIETLTTDLGPGESSLMKLIVQDKADGEPVLVSNDGAAFEVARGAGIGTMLEADYLALLVREGVVTCSDALLALESMLAKHLSGYRAPLGRSVVGRVTYTADGSSTQTS